MLDGISVVSDISFQEDGQDEQLRQRSYAEARAAYLTTAFELNDWLLMVNTLHAIARGRGMDVVARETGIAQDDLVRVLASNQVPDLRTFTAVIGALGLRLAAVPASDRPPAPPPDEDE